PLEGGAVAGPLAAKQFTLAGAELLESLHVLVIDERGPRASFFGAKPASILPAATELLPNHDVPDPQRDESIAGTFILAGRTNPSTGPLPFPFWLRQSMMARLRGCHLIREARMNGAPVPTGPTTRVPGARAALALLLAVNLFNYIDRYMLAALL